MTRTGSYLYAITRAVPRDAFAGVRGIGGSPVRAVPGHGLSGVVSSVDLTEFGEAPLRENLERLDWLERVAREHDAVIRAVGRQVAVLPLRLATVCRDDASVADRLAAQQDTASAALDLVEGRDEWGVKLFRRLDEPVAATLRPASGAEYLQRRRAELQQHAAMDVQAADDAQAIYHELARLAASSRQHRPQDSALTGRHDPMVLNAAYLVDRCDEAAFRAAVAQVAAARPAGTVEITGPWPPYSFVEWSGE